MKWRAAFVSWPVFLVAALGLSFAAGEVRAQSATSTALTSSVNPASAGQVTTLVATVSGSSPSGVVTFRDGTLAIGSAVLTGGQATLAVGFATPGGHGLTAAYGGDSGNAPSTSSVLTQSGSAVSPGNVTWLYGYDADGRRIPARSVAPPLLQGASVSNG
jgi:hypothetical protein